MDELKRLLTEGSINIEGAVKALVKQAMDDGQTLEASLEALIQQAKEQDVQPALDALILLKSQNHDELIKDLSEIKERGETKRVVIRGKPFEINAEPIKVTGDPTHQFEVQDDEGNRYILTAHKIE